MKMRIYFQQIQAEDSMFMPPLLVLRGVCVWLFFSLVINKYLKYINHTMRAKPKRRGLLIIRKSL